MSDSITYQDDKFNLSPAGSISKWDASTQQPSACVPSLADDKDREHRLYKVTEQAVVELLDTGIDTGGAIVADHIVETQPALGHELKPALFTRQGWLDEPGVDELLAAFEQMLNNASIGS